MFSLIYAVLLHPFPYADAARIMNPVCVDEQRPDETRWFATDKRQFETLNEARSIERVLGFAESNMEITGGAIPEDVLGTYLTGNTGSFFGVHALLGRGIEPFDDQGSGQHVAVLNYKFWQRHYRGVRMSSAARSSSITSPTLSSASCPAASPSTTPPAWATSTCRASCCRTA
jgi:hypothetical protein